MAARRAGIKFCGGCNPAYDRVAYVEALRSACGDRFAWRPFSDRDLDVLLVVNGCERACVEGEKLAPPGCPVITLRDAREPPEELCARLRAAIR